MRLKDKIAIITGGTGGLGPAVISEILGEGAKVTTTYIDESQLERIYQSISKDLHSNLDVKRTDVLKREEVSRLVAEVLTKHKRVDILVNLVGGYRGGENLHETGEETWQLMLNLNLQTTYLCCRGVIPQMIQQEYGKIVSVSARTGLEPSAGDAAYAVAKAGILALTRALSEEVKERNINVNAILPSIIDTEQNRKEMPDEDFSLWVKPQEIAKVIAFLASDDASSITGAAIPVYGKS